MRHQGASAYQQVARQTEAPRDLEANLLSRSASRLQIVRDDWDLNYLDLEPALQFNRKLWNVFMISVTRPDHPMPPGLRQNIANLGIFVTNHTIEVIRAPVPSKLNILININRNLAAGLREGARG